jgi:hypothetical protein
MNYLIIGCSLVFLLLAACQNSPQVQTGEDAEVIQGNRVRVDHARTKLAYIAPSAEFKKYSAILLAPLGVENVEIIQPSYSRRAAGNRNWELTDADKIRLQNDFQNALSKQLSLRGTYPLVTAAGDNVLLIAAKLTRIAPTAPKDDNRSRPAGRSAIVTEGAGKISVEVTFSDSETGEVLALAKDTRSGSSLWGLNNSITNQAQVRRVFNSWAIQIRGQLDKVHDQSIEE